MLVIGLPGLLLLACLIWRPLRRLIAYVALVIVVLAIGAFGHVQWINETPLLALPLAAVPFVLGWMVRRPRVRRQGNDDVW